MSKDQFRDHEDKDLVRSILPLKCYCVCQDNGALEDDIVACFLSRAESEKAIGYLKGNNKGLEYVIKESRLTEWRGK